MRAGSRGRVRPLLSFVSAGVDRGEPRVSSGCVVLRLGYSRAPRDIAWVKWSRAVLASCGLVVSACSLWDSEFPDSAALFVPPAQWRVWWEVLEDCSGRRGRFDDVTWFKAPFGEITFEGRVAYAMWYADGNKIALSRDLETDELVRHEMLHAVLQDGSHSDDYFLRRCGDVVLCGRDCPRQVAPPDPVPIRISQFDIDVEIFPRVPSLARYDDNIAFVLKVRNTTDRNGYADFRGWNSAKCEAGVVVVSAADPNRSADLCAFVGAGGLPRYFLAHETRMVLLNMRLQHGKTGDGPFFAEPLLVGAVLDDNVRKTVKVTVRP